MKPQHGNRLYFCNLYDCSGSKEACPNNCFQFLKITKIKMSLFGSTKWIKVCQNLKKKKLNKNCLFSSLHNESPTQIKIELLTTSEKSISIRYAILVYQDQWKHNLITKTYKKQRVSIRCPILVYHKKHTGHEGYQSEFSNFRQ